MRCPECGQWNRASMPTCQKCGMTLSEEERPTPAWRSQLKEDGRGKAYLRVDEDGEINAEPDARDSLADEMDALKKRKEQGIRQQRRLRRESAERGAAPSTMTIRTHASVETFWSDMNEPAEDRRAATRRGASGSRTTVMRGGEAQPMEDGWSDSRTYDPLWTETGPFDSRSLLSGRDRYSTKLPTRRRGWRRLIYTLVAMLCGALLAAAIWLGIQWNDRRIAAENAINAPLITSSIHNDLAAHTIKVPANDGETVYISELHASYTAEKGYATIEVEDHIWYDEIADLQIDAIEVKLTPYLKSASGRTSKLNDITYAVEIPQSPITLNSPDAVRQEVVTAMYSLQYTVRPGSTVYMNDVNISDTVDSQDGSLTYNATVQPVGDNVFSLRVRSPYCRENTLTVTLYREPQEIPLDLAADTYTSTTLKELQISCTTLPGATVDVLSDYTDLDITHLDSTGEFTFYAVFNKLGNNTITITSSYPGKKTTTVNYVIYYIPTASIYTGKAWPLSAAEYSELVSNITYRAEHNQVYVVMAKAAYIVSDKPQKAVFYTSDDGKSQPVLVENQTKTTWKVGTYYRVYADAYGTYDSMPWLIGRYCYNY